MSIVVAVYSRLMYYYRDTHTAIATVQTQLRARTEELLRKDADFKVSIVSWYSRKANLFYFRN